MNFHLRKLADWIFARLATKKVHRVAKLLLRISIRLLGYNNYGDADRTGEKYFLNYLMDRNPKFCIDIGANIGKYSDFILQNSDAQVLAFEPLPKSFEEAGKLTQKYPGRFEIVNKGVSNIEGQLILHFGNQTESATFSDEANQIPYIAALNQEEMAVPVISLDRYVADHPELPWNECNLLKIDTEGFEVEVILGAQNFITKAVPDFIQIEYNIHHLYRNQNFRSIALLLPHYTPFRLLPNSSGMVECEPSEVDTNIFQYANYVFISEEILNN